MKIAHIFTILGSLILNESKAAISLDFDGSTFTDTIDPSDGSGQMTWGGITTLSDGTVVDMIATVDPSSVYSPGTGPNNANGPLPLNGPNQGSTVPGGATRIKVQRNTDVTFNFVFVDQNGNPITLECTNISIYDFDETVPNGGGAIRDETVTLLGVDSPDSSISCFTIATDPLFEVDTSNPSQPVFTSSVEGNQGDNPDDLNNLTIEQSQKVVELNLVNTTGFTLNFAVGGTSNNNSRTFFIGGDVNFHPDVETQKYLIPEPSTMLLTILTSLLLATRKR